MNMSNIYIGRASIDEIKDCMGGRFMTTVYANNKDNVQKDGDYPFWEDIKHPDTGETLNAVKGYCGYGSSYDRPCYYAEYRGKTAYYYYIDEKCLVNNFGSKKTIAEQRIEDEKLYEENFVNANQNGK